MTWTKANVLEAYYGFLEGLFRAAFPNKILNCFLLFENAPAAKNFLKVSL